MTSGASQIFYASGCPFGNLLGAPLVGTMFSQEPRGCGKEMKILLTGGAGFGGLSFASRLAKEGHEVTVLIRPGERARVGSTGIAFLEGDPTQHGPWQEAVGDPSISRAHPSSPGGRMSEKRLIRESRPSTTRNLVEGIRGPIRKRGPSAAGNNRCSPSAEP
jgi:hypothetical protein